MADSYSGSGLTEEQEKQQRRDQFAETGMDALSTGAEYAALGASIGSAVPVLGTAAGAAAGFLLGAQVSLAQSFFSRGEEQEREAQAREAQMQAARAREDEQRALEAAQSLAKKGPDVNVRSLPGAPSIDSILMGSMPVRTGGSAPMDPYRQTVRNKFGWS